MSVTISEFIPRRKMCQFHAIIKACGGRYSGNPFEMGDSVSVRYVYDSVEGLKKHDECWRRVTQDVIEVRKDQWWRKRLRRLGLGFLCR